MTGSRLYASIPVAPACAIFTAEPSPAEGGPTPQDVRDMARDARIFAYPRAMMHRTMYLQAMSDETGAAFGIERGQAFDPTARSPEIREALQAGIDAAREQLKQESETFTHATLLFNTHGIGGDDDLNRALGVHVGIFGNASDIPIYNTIVSDAEGKLFDGGAHGYTMPFPADGLPPGAFFWPLTMSKLHERLLTEYPIDGCTIGSATPGVVHGEGDAPTPSIGPDSQSAGKESNWLPDPDGPLWMVLRNCGSGPSIADATTHFRRSCLSNNGPIIGEKP